MTQHKLSTNDNPFDPFEDFDNWYLYDIEYGYYSCSKLDRIVKIKDDFTEIEISQETERAIDAIIKNDFTDKFIKVTRTFPDLE